MVRGISLYGQVLQLINRNDFERLVQKNRGDRYSKGYRCWDQLAAMLFCHLGQAGSLSEICCGLEGAAGKIKHLGIEKGPAKSTLSYANKHRPWQIYEDAFYHLLGRIQNEFRETKPFRFSNKLFSLDGSVIDLCGSTFDWAHYQKSKGAVKLHLLLDHDGCLPVFATIKPSVGDEMAVADGLSLPRKSIVAIDRGYYNFALFQKWTKNEVYFVTRPRKSIAYDVVERRKPPSKSQVLEDRIIRVKGEAAKKAKLGKLRLVRVMTDKGEMEILTNIMHLSARTIAEVYRQRWQIESFFRLLKQNMRIKTFVGTTANALKIQIWTALISILVVKYLQRRAKLSWSISNLVAMLRWNLLTYRDLWEWIDNPGSNPAKPPGYTQGYFPGFGFGQQERRASTTH